MKIFNLFSTFLYFNTVKSWVRKLWKFLVNKYTLYSVILCCFVLKYTEYTDDGKYDGHLEEDMNVIDKFVTVLLWTRSYSTPFAPMGDGNEIFIKRRCLANNCLVTTRKYLLGNVTAFDAILFCAQDLHFYRFPRHRSPHQRYVFVTSESSKYYPLLEEKYDNFFNLTWTYKLDSDVYFGYIIIRNKLGEVVGPKTVMHWMEPSQMAPVGDKLKEILSRKSKAAAWFVSNCHCLSNRSLIGPEIGKHLARYNMTLDIYGKCGTKKCPFKNMSYCLQMLERDYYFYLSFENSFAEDYVTEKALYALQHHTVPIVFGGADYNRFLPPGSYLDARNVTVNSLVEQMVKIINNKEIYYDYFRWTNYYSYHKPEKSPETDVYCNFCSKINNAKTMNEISSYKSFTQWWNK